jgi:hypothetical protein
MPNISDSDIVPEPYQMRLVMWRDEFTRGYFEIGDIANEIVLLNIKSGMNVEHAQIYSAVGRFCGKSGRTVRDYAEISSFFPEETRKEYDMLPFSHFWYAKLHPDSSEGKLDFEFNFTSSDENILCEGVAVNNFSVASDVAPSVAVNLSGIYVLANLVSQAETILSWKMGKETRRKLLTALAGLKDVLQDLSENEQSLKFDYQATERPPRDGL